MMDSDYPRQIGNIDKVVKVIENLPIADDARQAVWGGNIARLPKV